MNFSNLRALPLQKNKVIPYWARIKITTMHPAFVLSGNVQTEQLILILIVHKFKHPGILLKIQILVALPHKFSCNRYGKKHLQKSALPQLTQNGECLLKYSQVRNDFKTKLFINKFQQIQPLNMYFRDELSTLFHRYKYHTFSYMNSLVSISALSGFQQRDFERALPSFYCV